MTPFARRAVLLAPLVSTTGCFADFEPLSHLRGLRLIAAAAEPAEARLGDDVTLRALAIDTLGQPISFSWSACSAPNAIASSATVNQGCVLADGGALLLPLGTGEQTKVTLPVVPGTSLGADSETLGAFLPIRLTVQAAPDRVIDGIYRMRVETHEEEICRSIVPTWAPNRNPVLAGIWVVPDLGEGFSNGTPVFDDLGPPSDLGTSAIPSADAGVPTAAVELVEGRPLEVRSGETVSLRALFTNDSFEHFCGLDATRSPPVVERTELLTVRWFTTAGSFGGQVTGQESSVKLTLNEEVPDNGVIDVFAVGRDDRGGTTWLHRTLVRR